MSDIKLGQTGIIESLTKYIFYMKEFYPYFPKLEEIATETDLVAVKPLTQ